MGAANVVPGVSGGTIAFITGIYEKLIDSLKAFDLTAIKLLLRFKFRDFAQHINLGFLIALFGGIAISAISLGKLLDYLFTESPVLVWSFFFGLIVASVYSVGRGIKKWDAGIVLSLLIGTAIAIGMAFLRPADENSTSFYLILCGVVAIASMLLPGLSGSFVLILMGNYQLIMLQAVPNLNFGILLPVGIGGIIGFIGLSHVISFLLKKAEGSTMGVLTGFILGSLLIIWPWKNEIYLKNNLNEFVLKDGERVITGYERFLPEISDSNTLISLLLMLFGAVLVLLLDRAGQNKVNEEHA